MRTTIRSGAKWESLVGYSRAIRVGSTIEVSGTVAMDGNQVLADNPYDETIAILHKIEKALIEAGGALEDVVRTRIFVTDISQWEEIGKAHGTIFKEIMPATSMVQVAALIDPRITVEIEATAILSQGTTQ